jgi:uncharacterized protein
MGRVLFFVLLGVAVYIAFRFLRVTQRRSNRAASGDSRSVSEPMISCAHCGLNVPRSEAVAADGRWYCSESHRRLESESR